MQQRAGAGLTHAREESDSALLEAPPYCSAVPCHYLRPICLCTGQTGKLKEDLWKIRTPESSVLYGSHGDTGPLLI